MENAGGADNPVKALGACCKDSDLVLEKINAMHERLSRACKYSSLQQHLYIFQTHKQPCFLERKTRRFEVLEGSFSCLDAWFRSSLA
jgi:hypothetical protein